MIDALIQLVAMIGIIGSLIFVGLEMRQSQRIALVSQIQARSYAVQASIDPFIEANKNWFSG
tara:strand:+ start:201 stop:386 length:186 start_codon:yes stop_codon:yes gene_type:complete